MKKEKPLLIWPRGMKMSHATTLRREGRVPLETCWLRPTEQDNKWYLQATNAHIFSSVVVTVEHEVALRERVAAVEAIPLPPKAMRALEGDSISSIGIFEPDGSVTVDDVTYHPPPEWPTDPQDGFPAQPHALPSFESLADTDPKPYEVGLDTDLLAKLARSMGCKRVKLSFDKVNLKQVRVVPLGEGRDDAKGLLMPIRLNA